MSVVLEDTFVDTNGTLLTAHTIAPTNVPATIWSGYGVSGGTTNITGNTVHIPDTSGPIPTTMSVNSGHSDVTVTVTMTNPNAGEAQGFFARFVDNSNGFFASLVGQTMQIAQVIAGSYGSVASVGYTYSYGTPYVYTMQSSGNNYTFTEVAGGGNVTYSSSTGNTGTLQGLITGQPALGLDMLYNDFIISVSGAVVYSFIIGDYGYTF